jgi:hypothetical protein
MFLKLETCSQFIFLMQLIFGAEKSDFLLPKSRLLRSKQSPLLLSVRGFKTK